VLGEALIQIHRDANVITIVLALQHVHDGKDYNGFEVHFYLHTRRIIEEMDAPPPTPEFIAQAVKYYTAVLESKKKAWKMKHPEPRPRGRPKKVVAETPHVQSA